MEDCKFRCAWAMACATCIGLLIAYLGLVPLGHWQADEYQTFGNLRESVVEFVRWRITSWSPRPLSEVFIYAYGWIVRMRGEPLVAVALLPCWALLVGASLAVSHRDDRYWRLVPLSMLSLFFLGHPVSDLFYWPMAALAYVPTLAAIVFVLVANECLAPTKWTTWALVCMALLSAAMCSEVGALFVLAYVVFSALTSTSEFGGTGRHVRLAMLALPGLAAIAILFQITEVRVGQAGEVFGEATIAHHLPSVLAKTIPRTVRELIVLDPSRPRDRSMILGFTVKSMFAIGVYKLTGAAFDAQKQRRRLVIALAALAMVPATIFAAYYQFGSLCCERHSTFRQCMVYVGVAASASWAAGWRARRAAVSGCVEDSRPVCRSWIAPACFLVAVLVAASTSIKKLAEDYRAYGAIAASRSATWSSGTSPGRVMALTPVYGARVVGNDPQLAAGIDHTDGPWISAVLSYFDKDAIRVIDDSSIDGDAVTP